MKIEIGKELLIIKSENMRFFVAVPISKAREALESAAIGSGEVLYDGRAIVLEYQTIRELQEKLGHVPGAGQVKAKLGELEAIELANFEAGCEQRKWARANEISRLSYLEAIAMLDRMILKAAS